MVAINADKFLLAVTVSCVRSLGRLSFAIWQTFLGRAVWGKTIDRDVNVKSDSLGTF